MNQEKNVFDWLRIEKFYKEQFDLWLLKFPESTRKPTWLGGSEEENAVVLKFGDQSIYITVPNPDNKDDDTIYFVKGKTAWDTFVNDFILSSEYVHFHKVLDKLLETINHYYRKDILQSRGPREIVHNQVRMEACGKIMSNLQPLIDQALTSLKPEEQYKISLDYDTYEWIFQLPIHDVITKEVAKAIKLDEFIPVTVGLKLQTKTDGISISGDLTVLRVEAYQQRSGKLNIFLKDIAWDYIEKNWGRVQYWMKYGKGTTLMFSTKANPVLVVKEKKSKEKEKNEKTYT